MFISLCLVMTTFDVHLFNWGVNIIIVFFFWLIPLKVQKVNQKYCSPRHIASKNEVKTGGPDHPRTFKKNYYNIFPTLKPALTYHLKSEKSEKISCPPRHIGSKNEVKTGGSEALLGPPPESQKKNTIIILTPQLNKWTSNVVITKHKLINI